MQLINFRCIVAKLKAAKLRPEIVAVIESWLRSRPAQVVVGGELGPPLWNCFYGDARQAIEEWFFTDADDLNAYREFSSTTPNGTILEMLEELPAGATRVGRS